MGYNRFTPLLLLLALSSAFAVNNDVAIDCADSHAEVSFVNFSEEPVTIFDLDRKDLQGELVKVAHLSLYESIHLNGTIKGRQFSYSTANDNVAYIVTESKDVHAIYDTSSETPQDILVECSTTKGDLHITVKPTWAPMGAANFLDLVRRGYYDGIALHRVIKTFLTQFGISANYEQRSQCEGKPLPDDLPQDIAFQPGYMSYAGYGSNARTTQLYIVMPGAHPGMLANEFGKKDPWGTPPFGYVDPTDLEKVVNNWHAYGDQPPRGHGPLPQKIYEQDGYSHYLKNEFPYMDYIQTCQIVANATGQQEWL